MCVLFTSIYLSHGYIPVPRFPSRLSPSFFSSPCLNALSVAFSYYYLHLFIPTLFLHTASMHKCCKIPADQDRSLPPSALKTIVKLEHFGKQMTTANLPVSFNPTFERTQQTFSQTKKFSNLQVSVVTFSGGVGKWITVSFLLR